MKKLLSILACVILTIGIACLVAAAPHVLHVTLHWLHGWLESERYLFITSSWTLTQQVFPHFGLAQVLLLYFCVLIGFGVIVRYIFRFLRRIWLWLPDIPLRPEGSFIVITVLLISLVLGSALGWAEWQLGRPSDGADILIGEKLSPVSTWQQQVAADERGMCYLRQDFRWWDSLHHVNDQGFLSDLPYTKHTVDSLHKAGKKVAFVIGDSFVEGFTTGSWDHTFGELLKNDMKDSYAVFTFGIGGTDPLDYQLRIEKFVPELKPDIVLLCFCGNNDIMEFDRATAPHVPILWTVNNTFFYSNLYNKVTLPTPDSLYRYLYSHTSAERASNKAAKFLLRKSHLLSLGYNMLHPWLPTLDGRADTCEASYRHLIQSRSACLQDSVPFRIVFIPDKQRLQPGIADYHKYYQRVFKDLTPEVLFPSDFSVDDFGKGNDIHFNDRGNRKFADFIESAMRTAK